MKKRNQPEKIRGKVSRATHRNALKNEKRTAWGNRGKFRVKTETEPR
jgi:hypothetical protein